MSILLNQIRQVSIVKFLRCIHAVTNTTELTNINLHTQHVPVLADEVIENLDPQPNQTFIDMTFGAGGHTKRILQSAPDAKIYALDRDPTAYQNAIELSKEFPNQIFPMLGKFSELPKKLQEFSVRPNSIDGILFDFGCSSMQFDVAERGFSISKNGYLDMRMDKDRFPNQPTAADILSNIDEAELAKIIKVYGEEKYAKKIARSIVEARYAYKPIKTTKELADLVTACLKDDFRADKPRHSHVATKVFQALRIFVNNELNEINYGLVIAQKYLKLEGRLVTITFHSLEDTIIKRHLMGNTIDNVANPVPLKYTSHTLLHDQDMVDTFLQTNWRQLHKHVITPKPSEIEANYRSRSAKLRVAVKIL